MQTLDKFIQTLGLTMKVAPRNSNPNMAADSGWHDSASHWTCTIHLGKRRLSVPFSQGSALTKPPELAHVLDCLASDASGYENAKDFADWCAEYGYDTDSRKAEKSYNTVKRQASKLHAMLAENYETLLYETERQ